MLRVYRIEYDEYYWYIAEGPDEAMRQFKEDMASVCPSGDNVLYVDMRVSCEHSRALCAAMIKDGRVDMILATSKKEIDQFLKDWGPEGMDQAVIKPFSQWAKERGRGFFASTV